MHFDFIAEGWKNDLDHMENYLNTTVFQMPITQPNGTIKKVPVPAALRPRRMYTYVFPREARDIVLNTLKPATFITRMDGKVNAKDKETLLKFPTSVLRKMLKLQKIPEPDASKGCLPIPMDNIRILGLGIRDDIDFTFKDGTTREAL